MSLLRSLQKHHEVCEEIYQVMLEVNRTLKAGAAAPDEGLLNRQRTGVAALDRALAELRSQANSPTPETRATMEKCQRTIMKALLLDRENEQLLLKNAMVRPPPPVSVRPNASRLAQAYARH